MVAGNTLLARARPWFLAYEQAFARALAIPIVIGIAWWFAAAPLSQMLWVGVIAYGIAHLLLLGTKRRRQGMPPIIPGISLVIDACMALLLVFNEPALVEGAIYPLYVLLALRALSVYERQPIATIVPFFLGPIYVVMHTLRMPNLAQHSTALWVLLFGGLSFGIVAIWSSAMLQRTEHSLRQGLNDAQSMNEGRVAQLERTANDLRLRMREQHALEEGLRVITSTLSLDEVLNQIVDSTVQMLGSARVYGMALSLESDGTFDHRSLFMDDQTPEHWAEPLTRRVIRQQVPLIIGDVQLEYELAVHMPQEVRGAISVPLFVGDGVARGALTVVSAAAASFSSSDARHLTAFAIQAGIAIGNAELHSRLRQQQHLFESVVRDISDGLVVFDVYGRVLLTNPLGRMLLESRSTTGPIREQLLSLATDIRTITTPMLTSEMRLADEDSEHGRVYQALASQVLHNAQEEPLIAVILHDITAQKDEERSRTEFISMVAHELRNPLNSLNGFVKIVLQGKAGALTSLQQEFLQIADGQVERLKGRISELLEFNRMEAGRLTLNPQWNDIPLLVTGTMARLQIQAEQAGLTLINEVPPLLPECLFDGERIGQVLTNLIENGMKATPPGGTITVRTELQNEEIWLRVRDTGVGISPEDQSKIFQAFYRAHDRTSSKGNHLGLGLAICQQIVEGHKGRIWVDSQEGHGSCFSFSLPLTEQTRAVNDEPGMPMNV